MRRLPQPATLPVSGHLQRWAGEPVALLHEGAALSRANGRLFALRLGLPAVVGYSPEWNRRLLTDLATFRSGGSFSVVVPYLSGGVILTDAGHGDRRAALNPPGAPMTQTHTIDATTHSQLKAIVDAALERRADDVKVLDLSGVSSTLDFFVIATATAGLQLNAVQENVKQKAMEAGLPRPTVEGPSERWLLMAFGASIVVHLMTREAREYYDLEGLWSDAREVSFAE